ncbi:MAG: lytic transglycosylase domain-containing protein [Gemmatimonadetes bacterium]|nr:lytic transglycosylase domain-containing protein [Gemmatimonadota bacterium]
MRLIPQFRALRAAARQSSVRQVALGMLLLGPASLWLSGTPPAGPDTPADRGAGGAQAEPVTRAWAARQLESARRQTIVRLADEFDVAEPLAADIHDAAVSEAIEPRLAFSLVRAESRFRARAVSPGGAVGLTQVLPSTASWLAPGTGGQDLLRPEVNLRVGFRYLRHLLDQYDGNQRLALTAYNRGPGTVDRLLKHGHDPDNGYAEKVLAGDRARSGALRTVQLARPGADARQGRNRS